MSIKWRESIVNLTNSTANQSGDPDAKLEFDSPRDWSQSPLTFGSPMPVRPPEFERPPKLKPPDDDLKKALDKMNQLKGKKFEEKMAELSQESRDWCWRARKKKTNPARDKAKRC